MAGAGANLITLTKVDPTQYAVNRKAMCPTSCCGSGVLGYVNDDRPRALPRVSDALTSVGGVQLDEFPFAGTVVGGNPSNGNRKSPESW